MADAVVVELLELDELVKPSISGIPGSDREGVGREGTLRPRRPASLLVLLSPPMPRIPEPSPLEIRLVNEKYVNYVDLTRGPWLRGRSLSCQLLFSNMLE